MTQHGERSWHNFHSPVNKRWFVPEKVKSLNSSSEGKEIKAGCASICALQRDVTDVPVPVITLGGTIIISPTVWVKMSLKHSLPHK